MAFDDRTRNRLQRFVSDARALLSEEFTRQMQHEYGMDPTSGEVTDLEKLSHMDDSRRETVRVLRDTLAHYLATTPSGGKQEALQRILREQAFTVLNRLAALRMMEARGFLIESIAEGYQSKGYQLYQRLAGSALWETGDAYRCYLFCLFDEFALDLAVLFDRFSPQGRLFPRETALLGLLELINHPEIESLWAEDETIGWIYQYFNSQEERRQMRADSAAPRNSRELAVRNQFFTPRYVVEFLTDNTLGRLWYEMTQGQTVLTDQCRYVVRRPNESFLQSGEEAPVQEEPQEELSQEELLKQPVHIPFRTLKDPRDITMLDPACGSMHFGLYAFDLFEVIYNEAWEIAHCSDEAQKSSASFAPFVGFVVPYPDKAAFLADVPRLIIEHNLHGIDIDPRAVQIAGLSLWLRAQRTWRQQGLRPQDCPRIRRSHIVCAEPMPGEEAFLEEFIEAHLAAIPERKLLGQLVRRVFDAMKLAGEAGSLLKIEEEIAGAVVEAKQKWIVGPKPEQGRLFADDSAPPAQEELSLDVTGITDETFWEKAEERIYAALQTYAEEAEHGGAYQRRLFADDAARGFAFIDLCRKRYDVVVMNPPFGAFAKKWKADAEATYPNSSNDIYAAFIERFLGRLERLGRLGAITSRACFYTTSFIDWRENVVSAQCSLDAMVDLGEAVMDGAMVEAAAYIITNKAGSPRDLPTIWMREFRITEREGRVLASIDAVRSGYCSQGSPFFVAHVSSFATLTGKPFVYWVAPRTVRQLSILPHLEPSAADVRKGLRTGDNFRFVRCLWEISPAVLTTGLSQASTTSERSTSGFVPLVLSGSSQPWFAPILVGLNWQCDGRELRQFVLKYGGESRLIQGKDYYYRAGISWTRRATRFIPYAIPAGCIPTGSRPMAFPRNCDGLLLLAITASNCASAFMRFYGEKFLWPNFLEGKVKLVPWPSISSEASEALSAFVAKEIQQRNSAYRDHEPFHSFLHPELRDVTTHSAELQYSPSSLLGEERETVISKCYGLTSVEASALCQDLADALATRSDRPASQSNEDEEDDDDSDSVIDASPRAKAGAVVSYAVGTAFGRWDIRFATGERPAPELPDPFAPLPVCPPGQLQNEQGLPITSEDVTRMREEGCWHYPLEIPWDGILVDDPGHALDLDARVHQVLQIIWKDRWEAIEREACEILGVRTLRDYFCKPAGFFADHLKRYSKSRRKAPIYWPLQTPSGSYTLWLYYHRLNDQTLYTCVNDFIEKSKLREVTEQLHVLRTKTSRNKQEEKDLERLVDLEQELKDFRDELLRVAKFWKPNLNDGVQITAAPLWKLFQHKPWQKTLKETWDRLEHGAYDWAHLAYSIWPDRVREKCKHDKSLAIAHGLEELYEEPSEQPKKRRGRTRG